MKHRNEKGSAVVETALVVPILLLLVFGIADFGIALYRQEVLTNATREGARAGVILAVPAVTCDQVKTVVTNYLQSAGWNQSLATVNASGGCAPPVPSFGSNLTVTATYPHTFIVLSGFLSSLPASITLTSQTVMKHE